MNRITQDILVGKLSTVNELFHRQGHGQSFGLGRVSLQTTDAGTAVVERIIGSGYRQLSEIGTEQETFAFLDGMIEALRITAEGNER